MHLQKGPRGSLPEHIRLDPAVLDWRLSQLEERIEALEERPAFPSLPDSLTWGRAAVLIVLLIAGIKGHIAPETMAALAGKLLGLP